MNKIILAVVLGLFVSVVQAVDVVGQNYIDGLARSGLVGIKQVAKNIYTTNEQDVDVLDVVAEVLLSRYSNVRNQDIDTLAWLCNAIGNSGNDRYHKTLKEVVDSKAHKKLRKYAKKALKQVGKPKGAQYVKGTVDLVALRKDALKKINQGNVGNSTPGKQKINVIREGMSMGQVHDLLGEPTDTFSHITGNAFKPFNFGQKDVSRTVFLYRGQGRVVFSNSGYNNARVLEVIIDPTETGYP